MNNSDIPCCDTLTTEREFHVTPTPCARGDASALPSDILSMIFEVVAVEEKPYPPVDKQVKEAGQMLIEDTRDEAPADYHVWRETLGENGSLGWIRLSHVCKIWRGLLPSMELLWSSVLGRLPLADDELLGRVGEDSHLSVTATSTPFNFHEAHILRLLDARAYLSRLRFMRLVRLWEGFPLMKDLERSPTGQWERLEVLETHFYSEMWHNHSLSYPGLRTPLLRVARFDGYMINFKSTSLRELYLIFVGSGSSNPPMGVLIDILRNNAGTLESLELVYALEDDFEKKTQLLPKLSLPRLRKLRLDDGPLALQLAFINHMQLPPSVQFDLDIFTKSRSGDDFHEDVKPLLDAVISTNRKSTWDSLTISPDEGTPDTLCFQLRSHSSSMSSTARVENAVLGADDAKLQLLVVNGADYEAGVDIRRITFIEISHLLDPRRFVTLSFGGFPLWRTEEIAECLHPFTSLSALHIIDPLEHGHSLFNNQPEVTDDFPFLSFLNIHNATPGSPSSSSHMESHEAPLARFRALDILWLVQNASTSRFSCATWCNMVANQLRHTLCEVEAAPINGGKPIQVLRISYLAAVLDGDKDVAEAAFAEVADVVEWMTG